MICSICVATYKRPELLKNLLDSLVVQVIPDEVKLEIIIIDNDPEGSARDVYKQFHNIRQVEFSYDVQPIKNISLTRNKAVKKSTGDFLLFIDDDEVAGPDWVAKILKTIIDYEADGVFGRIIAQYNRPISNWKKKYFMSGFTCPKTGTEASDLRTGNCIIKASIIKGIAGPFDAAYGTTGGEDRHLFERLKRKGARFINCFEAWTSEIIPPERTQILWLLKRALRTGNIYTRIMIELEEKNKSWMKLNAIVKAICFGVISTILILFMFPSKFWRFHWTSKLASNLGHLFAMIGYYFHGYK